MNELFLLLTDFILKDCHLQNNHAFEFIGKVQQDLSVRVLASTDFGPEGNIGMISHCSLTLVLGPPSSSSPILSRFYIGVVNLLAHFTINN